MTNELNVNRVTRRYMVQALRASLCGAVVWALPGCSLGVMFGKMVMGDPLIPAEFKTMTKEDLTKGKHTVLVVCKAPDSIESDNSTLSYDLIAGVTRRLQLHGIKVIKPDDVNDWIDEHGGIGKNPAVMAQDFDTDYVILIDIHQFTIREPNSPKLLRGQASGTVYAYEMSEVGGYPKASNVFTQPFKTTYPEHQPISEQGRTTSIFEKQYRDRICDQLAEYFYDHRPGTGF